MVLGPQRGVCSIHGRMSFKAEAGHHLAPMALSSGRNVFEELGDGFTLLALDADEAAVRSIEAAARSIRRAAHGRPRHDDEGRERYGRAWSWSAPIST